MQNTGRTGGVVEFKPTLPRYDCVWDEGEVLPGSRLPQTEAVVMADSVCEPDLALSTDAGCDPILGLGPVAREVSCQGNSIEGTPLLWR